MGDAADDAERRAEQEREEGDVVEAEPMPVVDSALSEAAVQALTEPLDPNRIKKRKGRGRGQFEYIAHHDAVRTANRIFGYGNWGHEVVVQERIGEVAVEKRDSDSGNVTGEGFHVAYRCVVRLTVKGCVPVSGTGYGDATEYTPAALLTASELALKESESDAVKRALKNFGDQFGLILYAKKDERDQIESDKNEEVSIRRDTQIPRPEGWVELTERFGAVLGGHPTADAEAAEWISQAVAAKFDGKTSAQMTRDEKTVAFVKLSAVLLGLEEAGGDLALDADNRLKIMRAFAEHFDGIGVAGPPWRITPRDPVDVPEYEDYIADQAHAEDEQRQAEAEQEGIDNPPVDAEVEQIAAETFTGAP